jgi:hypothetical protein
MRFACAAGQQAIDDLADYKRGEGAVVAGPVDQSHEPHGRVEEVGVERADIDRPDAVFAAWLRDARLDHYRRDDSRVE